MKLLLSGATGFVGTHLTVALRQAGHKLSVIARDGGSLEFLEREHIDYHVFTGDISELIAFVTNGRFNGAIHLASLFLAQHTVEQVGPLIDSNVKFSSQLLEAATKAGVPWFINTGTFWQHYQNAAFSPVNLYAATKQAFEDVARYYLETTTINFVTVKLCDTFGPNDTRPKLFTLWQRAATSGERLDMSAGEQLIDVSYIDNVTDAFARLVELLGAPGAESLRGRSFAVSSGERMTLKELARVFEEVTDTALPINWGARPYRPREVMVPWEHGEPVPGWQPKVTVREGIMRTFHG